MKKFLLILTGFTVSLVASAQAPKVDTVAVMILNRMADVIGDLKTCSFNLSTSADVSDYDHGTIKQTGTNEVFLVGPDKMLVHSYGDKGHRGFWYNGEKTSYYSFDENNYATVETPSDIISAIAFLNVNYGIEFPAADFFYPTFTDDILGEYNSIFYLGMSVIGGKECFHILASNENQSVQFWIANDAFNLPQKFVIIYKNTDMQYEATFSNWAVNQEIPNSVFEFMPPPMAAEIILLPKNNQ
ncbi:MAG: DUF2092 domain-containing protein [Ferruginibacter sp.]